MGLPILHLELPQTLQQDFKVQHGTATPNIEGPVLTCLNRLNAFVGVNNSGKSRLLRGLFANHEWVGCQQSDDLVVAYRLIKMAVERLPRDSEPPGFGGTSEFLRRISRLKPVLRSASSVLDNGVVDKVVKQFRSYCQSSEPEFLDQQTGDDYFPTWRSVRDELSTKAGAVVSSAPLPKDSPAVIYIPTLRGLRPVSTDTHRFAERTYQDYFHGKGLTQIPNANACYEWDGVKVPKIFTGEQMYDIVQGMLLGTITQRKAIAEYQKYLSRFFEGADVTLIPKLGAEKRLVAKIGNEEERPIHELGDGLQHLIIQTFPLFIHGNTPLLLFIEEPELYLHPGFQRLLIEAFLDESDKPHQVLVATHSHQFLDLTLDRSACSFFRVAKDYNDTSAPGTPKHVVESMTDEGQNCLRDLGVLNSSVLLSNCTIWVEGTTDRRYLQKYLEIYQREARVERGLLPFVEDLHFSFVEYGGGNIVHWSFSGEDGEKVRADRLSQHIFVIMDNDNAEAGSEKWRRAQRLKECLGDRFAWLECTEMENLLAPHVVRGVIDYYDSDNSELQIADDITHDRYFGKKLGQFIDEEWLDDCRKSRRNGGTGTAYAVKSGTVKGKVEFCRIAVEKIVERTDMCQQAWELAEKVFKFIEASNPQTGLRG